MWRFLFLTVILTIVGGTILHYEVSIPYVTGFLGKIPGDFVLENKDAKVQFPVASAAIVSFIVTCISWLFSRKKEN